MSKSRLPDHKVKILLLLTYTTVVAEINNQSGTATAVYRHGHDGFYILGSVLVLGAAVVLVTRKRMKEHN